MHICFEVEETSETSMRIYISVLKKDNILCSYLLI